ncbi:MAG: Dna2/Cas4 domain-containing protein [Nitrososphaerota archaeon]|nr:Dna2/Cas4 domain-containing protein [Nitrososphaerota archaeon]
MDPLVALLILTLVLVIIWAIYRTLSPKAIPGPVVAVDGFVTSATVGRVVTMSSQVHGLVGRPDELRRTPDGNVVPIEVKSSRGPPPGRPPYFSHVLQLYAYCQIVEDRYGVAPTYGLLIYSGGTPRRVAWDDRARQELAYWVARVREPYRGDALPTVPKCLSCAYLPVCDRAARMVPGH